MPMALIAEKPGVISDFQPGDVVRHKDGQGFYARVLSINRDAGTFSGFSLTHGKHSDNWPISEFDHFVGILEFDCS